MVFQSREHLVVQRGQVRGIGWAIKILEAQVGQFLLGCKCPVSRGIVVREQDRLGDLPEAFFPPKCPSVAPAEMSKDKTALVTFPGRFFIQNVLQLHQQK